MQTIRFKITILTMMAIIVCVLGVGGSSAVSVRREGERSSAEMMRLLCDNSAMTIDSYLNSVEQSVDMVTRFALDEISAVELVKGGVVGLQGTGEYPAGRSRSETQQTGLDAYLSGYFDRVETLFRSVANRTNGVVSFYLRINPEISEESSGFLYSNIGRSTFRKLIVSDLTAYRTDDVEHVGWYYIPLERGAATWIEPYYNRNLNMRMISYVAPLYKAGTFIGVVGMDIGCDTLAGQIDGISLYDTGFAFLIDEDGRVVFHPELPAGFDLVKEGSLTANEALMLRSDSGNAAPMHLTATDGQEQQLFFSTLSNGMKLVVTAPVNEINAPWRAMMARISVASVFSLAVFTVIAILTVRHMTEPLKKLAEASESIAQGNYNVRLEYNGRDEVGRLTAAFQHLVDHLNVYISDLNSRAYQDALTSVRNRSAFAISQRKLDDSIRAAKTTGEYPRFGIVMLDCNNLKKINDTFGHEKGDAYLRASCTLVCKMFPHSPVFRLGGDEFAVLLLDSSYDNRDALLANFDYAVQEHNRVVQQSWESVSLAKGTAIFDPKSDANADSVLSRADELMYADKKRMKSENRDGAR